MPENSSSDTEYQSGGSVAHINILMKTIDKPPDNISNHAAW